MKWNFCRPKKLGYADSLSSLIPKFLIPLKDTVIAALKAEKEVKDVHCSKRTVSDFS